MTRLITCWNSKYSTRSIALKSLMVMPNLLLQKTSAKSKTKQNKEAWSRRLILWKEGKIDEVFDHPKSTENSKEDMHTKRDI